MQQSEIATELQITKQIVNEYKRDLEVRGFLDSTVPIIQFADDIVLKKDFSNISDLFSL